MAQSEQFKIKLQYARWQDLPREVQDLFISFLDGNILRGQRFYQLYFYWYNIAHEVGHVLRGAYQKDRSSMWDEEMACNQLAVAYWRAKGQSSRLLEMEREIRSILSLLPDPVPANEDRAAYFNKHFQEMGSDPAAYGHYQWSMVRSALERPLDFSQALKMLVTPAANDGSTIPLAPDLSIDENLPLRIVGDMERTLAAYGLSIPAIQVVCAYAPALQFVEFHS